MNVIFKLLNSPLGSALKVFIAVILTVILADWTGAGTINFTNWQTWIIVALASAVPVVVNWLNPFDPRYGRKARRDG